MPTTEGNFPNPETTTLDVLWDSYVTVRRLGPETKTPKNYHDSWSGLVRGMRDTLGREPVVSDLSAGSLTAYLRYARSARGWNEQSTKTNAGNIKSIVSKSEEQHLLAPGTLAGFQLPKVTESDPVFFDDATLAMIFDALEHRRTTLDLRLRVAANIMLDCGARSEEVATITFADLFEASSQIRLYGKGAKQRVVPVGDRTWQYLRDYMRVRPRPARLDEPVLVDVRAGVTGVEPTTLASDMHDLLISLGLVDPTEDRGQNDPGYKLYTFRKTFARRSAEGEMDVMELATIMGHSFSSIPMLMRLYYRPTEKHKRAAHTSARPADSFHEWRATPDRAVQLPDHSTTFFDEYALPARSIDEGKAPASSPTSRNRTRGEYRATSRSSSQWATGA